jgi:alpha/beta superfamily hydrolase
MHIEATMIALIIMASTLGNADAVNREATICGSIKERFYFWMWSMNAPSPDPTLVAQFKNIDPINFTTADNKKLTGYKYNSHNSKQERTKPNGYLLVALGNAMIADRMITSFGQFAQKGLDVYIYDYRGYGNSEGKRRLNAMIEDYKEIASSFNQSYDRKYLYGISLGGVFVSNVIGSGIDFDAAIIDSSPSRLSTHGCPQRIDPVENLPKDSSKLLVITGKQDQVLGDNMTQELREVASEKGAKTIHGESFAHPFMDSNEEIHQERMDLIMEFLVESISD